MSIGVLGSVIIQGVPGSADLHLEHDLNAGRSGTLNSIHPLHGTAINWPWSGAVVKAVFLTVQLIVMWKVFPSIYYLLNNEQCQ